MKIININPYNILKLRNNLNPFYKYYFKLNLFLIYFVNQILIIYL